MAVSGRGVAVSRANPSGPGRGAMETARGLRVPRRGTARAERRSEVPRHGTMTPRSGLDGGGGDAAGPRHDADVPPAASRRPGRGEVVFFAGSFTLAQGKLPSPRVSC